MPAKILVVDDDAEIIGFVMMGLKNAGFEVFSAADGEEGLSMARSSRPDLVVLDLAMPRKHGFMVCQEMREDKDLAKIKIIVTSGKNYAVDHKTAKDMGADLYVVKPYGMKQLVEAIQGLLKAP